MAPGFAILAYPLLLAAVYGAFRVGRESGLAGRSWIEWARLCVLSVFFVVVTALQIRFAQAGVLASTWGVFVGVASLAAMLGMLGLHAFAMVDAWDGSRAGAPAPLRAG